ncbi:MAG: ATP-binding protein [Clostridia bacterium]|nr:ATP-binding protein [Clostridia bacterium]
MKLLSISAKGLPLFNEELCLSFYAGQRVSEVDKDHLHLLRSDSRFYLNNVHALIGINASGKTSVLKVILLALNLLNNEPINHMETRDILGQAEKITLNVCFYSDCDEVCRLQTVIVSSQDHTGGMKYAIKEETLWTKPASSVTTKKRLLDFDGIAPVAIRSSDEAFLPDDISIIIAYNKQHQQHILICDLLSLTNINILPVSDDIPPDIVAFLDPTVENLSFAREDKKVTVHLKFKGKPEIVLADPAELNQYLSSGTVKGIVTFSLAIRVLKSGGYLVIDELENHFNKEIVATLIRFFMDAGMNRTGGTLIFTTHYPELLDEFERNDCISIIRNRDGGITVNNLTDILKRNDIKKSDAYLSGFIEGTVPNYEAYTSLKKSIRLALQNGADG